MIDRLDLVAGRLLTGGKAVSLTDPIGLLAWAAEGGPKEVLCGEQTLKVWVDGVNPGVRLIARMVDGPITLAGWEQVNDTGLHEETQLLCAAVEHAAGRGADHRTTSDRQWQLSWGTTSVRVNARDFDVALFLELYPAG